MGRAADPLQLPACPAVLPHRRTICLAVASVPPDAPELPVLPEQRTTPPKHHGDSVFDSRSLLDHGLLEAGHSAEPPSHRTSAKAKAPVCRHHRLSCREECHRRPGYLPGNFPPLLDLYVCTAICFMLPFRGWGGYWLLRAGSLHRGGVTPTSEPHRGHDP